MKRLEEEREKSFKKESQSEPDSKKNLQENNVGGPRLTSPENRAAGRPNSGEASDSYEGRENRSYNESNSTSQKRDSQQRNDVVNGKTEPEPENRNELDPPRTESKPGKVVDRHDDNMVREDNAKQSSDVQSSMSLSRKKRRRRVGGGGAGASSSGEEPEGDEVSPATKRVSALKSEPLVKLLSTVRSHRLGSVFQRRLRSQVLTLLLFYYYFILFIFLILYFWQKEPDSFFFDEKSVFHKNKFKRLFLKGKNKYLLTIKNDNNKSKEFAFF